MENESIFNLTPMTAYLAGVIVGDGNLSNYVKSKKNDLSKDYRIYIDISDISFLNVIEAMIKSLVKTRATSKPVVSRGNRLPRKYFAVRNKCLFLFFSEFLGIQTGSKSSTVCVPKKIMHSSLLLKSYFLAGYFDADGGFRGNSLGFTTASKLLWEDVTYLLNDLLFVNSRDVWINKKYNKTFYGIKIRKGQIDRFLNTLPLHNDEKLKRISQRFKCGDAGVVKRDRLF